MEKSIINAKSVYLTDKQLCEMYSISMNTARNYADESGAVIRFGRTRRTNKEIFEKYMEENHSLRR